MRKFLTVTLVLGLILPGLSIADGIFEVDRAKNIYNSEFLGYVPNRFVIVLKEDVTVDHAKDDGIAIALSNLDGFAELTKRFDVTTIKPQFPGADRAEKTSSLSRY